MQSLIKIIFFLPVIVWNTLIPINKYTYRPSSEHEREVSQNLRNVVRLSSYNTKRLVRGDK